MYKEFMVKYMYIHCHVRQDLSESLIFCLLYVKFISYLKHSKACFALINENWPMF